MTQRNKIIIGTRGSKLALWQASYIAGQLKDKAKIESELKIIKTKGDKILDVALAKVGDKGLFVKEIENELLAGNIDIAVHSMKDLPTEIPEGLKIAASSPREDCRDAMVSLEYKKLEDLPAGSVIGSSSLRRRAQVLARRPDLVAKDIRGNVDTRLKKLEEGEYQAIIMAVAGLKRLEATEHMKQIFTEDEMLPAVGQGAVAIEARSDDKEVLDMLSLINDEKTLAEVTAERALMKELEGGCQVPIGALAKSKNGEFELSAVVSSLDGKEVVSGRLSAKIEEAEQAGIKLAKELQDKGADKILAKIRESGS